MFCYLFMYDLMQKPVVTIVGKMRIDRNNNILAIPIGIVIGNEYIRLLYDF